MTLKFADLKIGFKIAIACLVPLAGLIGISAFAVYDAWSNQRAALEVLAATDLAEDASLVIHELQKERGMSAGFIASKGQQFTSELPPQRQATDARIQALRQLVTAAGDGFRNGTVGSRLAAADTDMQGLETLRKSVAGQSIAAGDAAAVYTRMISSLLSVAESIGGLSRDAGLAQAVSMYTAAMRGKEQAGQERATGARGFGAGRFTPADLRAYLSLAAAQNEQFDVVNRLGSPVQQERLKAALTGSGAADVARMRDIALKSSLGESTDRVTGADWFKAATARIDELKKFEDSLTSDLRETASAVNDRATRSLFIMLAIALGLTFVASAIAFFSARSITTPLASLLRTTLALAEGNTNVQITGTQRKDEIGDLSRAVAVFRDNAIERARLEEEARATVMQREERQRRVEALISHFSGAVGTSLGAVGQNAALMDQTAKSLAEIAAAASGQATGAAGASEEASANVQNVASAAEELAASIHDIGRQVDSANTVVRRAVELANSSSGEIEALSGAAQRIGDVVGMIQAIAAQTNLLALNATIEAARAGEAGRGFTIVASEVKSLAAQTAKATEDIASQISAIQGSSTKVVECMKVIASTMHEVNTYTSSIAAAVEEQGTATQEISRNVQMAARGTEELNHNVSGVTGAIGETSRSAENVLDSSRKLTVQANTLRDEVDHFLKNVSAA